ncbi:MAG: hypothetical protein HYY35_10845 [Deltaproteobacteria bacterium]|nr:hypothetical protein [Deltaproteobacteria bacterium]
MKDSRQLRAETARIDSVPRLIGRIAVIALTVFLLWVLAKSCAVPPHARDGKQTDDQGGNESTKGVPSVPAAPPEVGSGAAGDP